MSNLDWLIFQKINGLAGKFFWLDILAVFLAKYFIYLLFVLAIFLILYFRLKRKQIPRQELLILIFIVSASFLLHLLIGLFYFRPRPYVFHPEVFKLGRFLKTFLSTSFPSGHATLSFSLAFAIMLMNKKLGWWLLFFAFLIGLARIFVGVHWPSDILASLLLTFILSRLAKKLLLPRTQFWRL